ncbi:phage tail protein [Pedobacter chitinilyticus]|nr:tail fiber protein [Pedobacter chitinilyticus]
MFKEFFHQETNLELINMDGTIGEIRIIAANFAPRNWAFCQGQTIPIQNNTALFAIIGTTFGGNGATNYMLPNFSGRVALGVGQRPGGSNYVWGQVGGEETHTLVTTEMPAHTHAGTISSGPVRLMVSADDSTLAVASAGSVISAPGYLVTGGLAKTLGFNNATPNTVLHPDSIKANNTSMTLATAGGISAHNNMQPFLALNHIICMYGTFPSRN